MRRPFVLPVSIAFLVWGTAAVAHGQGLINEREGPLSFQNPVRPPDEPLWDTTGQINIWTAIYTGGSGTDEITVLSPTIRAHYDFVSDWGGHFAMPLAAQAKSSALVRFANLTLGAHRRLSHEATSGIIGFDVALPTAWVADDLPPDTQDILRRMFLTSAAANGGMDFWLWAPERLSLVLSGGATHRFGDVFDVFAEAALAPMFPVGDEGTDVDLFIDASVGGQWVIPELLNLGLRFQLAWLPTAQGDPLQTSLELFGRVWLDALFLGLAFTLNLDEPAGFSFDTNGVWGLHVGVGVRF